MEIRAASHSKLTAAPQSNPVKVCIIQITRLWLGGYATSSKTGTEFSCKTYHIKQPKAMLLCDHFPFFFFPVCSSDLQELASNKPFALTIPRTDCPNKLEPDSAATGIQPWHS